LYAEADNMESKMDKPIVAPIMIISTWSITFISIEYPERKLVKRVY
jgi:hypothetical protein